MSKLTLDYPHLADAELIFKVIKKYFDDFDWWWADADRAKNFKAVQKVITDKDLEDVFDIRLRIVDMEDGYRIRSCFTYDHRLKTYVDLFPDDWIENQFDFISPLDVLSILDELQARAMEFKSFYQIKVA